MPERILSKKNLQSPPYLHLWFLLNSLGLLLSIISLLCHQQKKYLWFSLILWTEISAVLSNTNRKQTLINWNKQENLHYYFPRDKGKLTYCILLSQNWPKGGDWIKNCAYNNFNLRYFTSSKGTFSYYIITQGLIFGSPSPIVHNCSKLLLFKRSKRNLYLLLLIPTPSLPPPLTKILQFYSFVACCNHPL